MTTAPASTLTLAEEADGHGAVVDLVAHEGLDADGARGAAGHLVGIEIGGGRERLLGEAIAGADLGGSVYPDIGDMAEPVVALGVEVVEPVEGAAVQKAVAQVGDAAFDLALGAGAVGAAAFGLEGVVTHEVLEAGADAVGADDDLAHVVVEDAPGPSAEEGKGVLMAADERVATSIERVNSA
jgi:hypothetical protein